MKKQSILSLALLLFFQYTIIAQSPVPLAGQVRNRLGEAVRNAMVTLSPEGQAPGATTRTDSEGRFVLTAAPGRYELRVALPGYSPNVRQVAVSGAAAPIEIVLEPATVAETITVTAGRAEMRLADAPASVSVLTSRDVRNAAAQTLDDLLRQVPGFSLFRRTSSIVANPTTQGVSLRGAGASGASRTLVLSDGIPLNDAFGGWVYWDRVPRASIDQIEIVRGGSSDLYGSDALSGVINLRTQPPTRLIDLDLSYGSRGTQDATFFASEKWKGFSASVSGESLFTNGYFIIPPELRGLADQEAASDHRALALRLQQDWSPTASLFARGALFDEDRQNGTVIQRNDTTTESLAVGGRFRTRDGSNWNLAVFGNQQRFHQNFTAVAAGRNSEALTRLQFVPSRDAGASLNWSRLSFERHLFVAGFDVRGVRGTSDETVFVAGRPTTFVSAGGRQRRAGFFAQDILQLASRLTLTLSGRYDNWRDSSAASVERTLATGAVRPRFFAPRSEEAFSPRINLAYAVRPQVTLRAAAYRAFRAPTLNELYRSFRVGDTQTLANAALNAERLTGGEIGAAFAPARIFNARLTTFWTETNNPISNFTLTVTPALITRERRNLGRTRARGLEAEADLNVSDRWRITAGYLLVDAIVRRAPQDASLVGQRLPQVPRHLFTLQTVYSNPRIITAAIQFRATGRQFDDDQNRLPLGSFALIDASVSRPLTRNVDLFFSVQNLLDERFIVARTPIENIGMPRLVRGGLRFRWER
ncbi:MAG: TonB-dependent receptor [Blastocatellia bacterium]|nr:TonB-dependent receptor [Blastocatellia bacterium]